MTDETSENSVRTRIIQLPGNAWRWLADSWSMSDAHVRNWRRKLRRASVDYVLMPVGGSLPERAEPKRGFLSRRLPWWPTPPLSMEYLNGRLQLIADADNVRGVLFVFRGLGTGLATIQNFRRSLQRLREAGKESIVFTPYLDLRHYYAASAADRIYAPPGASFTMLGLYADTIFLKDALQQIGVSVDVVQISPYKTAFDNLQHAELTPQYREQLNWLLDDQYHVITAEIAESRGLSQAGLKKLIDEAPHFVEDAVELGLIDGLAYEDELARILSRAMSAGERTTEEKQEATADSARNTQEREQVDIRSWPKAFHLLQEKPRRRSRKFVGVISLEGLITMGPSRRSPIDLPIPFLGGATAGEQTIVDLLRRSERLSDMAALVFHVDSGGGSALASDFIGREIERIGRKIPVVAYMGNVAASGGYYVSAPAQHIMAQSGTTTGSIGVITMRASTRELYEKLHINSVSFQRGANANLYGENAPMNDKVRGIFTADVVHSYEQFKEIVARGRRIPYDDLDPICEGRVWTGSQARKINLVDALGDFVDVLRQAAELAGLPVADDSYALPVVNLTTQKDGYRLPPPFEEIQEMSQLLSTQWQHHLSGAPLWLLPIDVKFR